MREQEVTLTLCIHSKTGQLRAQNKGVNTVEMAPPPYQEGDRIVLYTSHWPVALQLQLDKALPPALVWLVANRVEFPVPFGEPHDAYPPEAFVAQAPLVWAKLAPQTLWGGYRNLSENPLDRRGETVYFPHCTASVETRDESVFAARNTIDGVVEPKSHGAWPYQSWGDDENPHAEIMIEFGRTVTVDKAVINLRADFPHDSYWQQATLLFSDGSSELLHLHKTGDGQEFAFAPRAIEWMKMTQLVKAEDDSPFPALTQWGIWGQG
ncbi:carbohydrate-binding protein [Ruminococcaceae bacterium OttesenSCG-928-A16]|nr:carbohydrate-binding protein [Ruminococcaceae bacterium OttesenSCG-928-A16]